jgi:hypothetical protein
MPEEKDKQYASLIEEEIIKKLRNAPTFWDFAYQFEKNSSSTFNPWLECHYTKPEMNCFFKKESNFEDLKEFDITHSSTGWNVEQKGSVILSEGTIDPATAERYNFSVEDKKTFVQRPYKDQNTNQEREAIRFFYNVTLNGRIISKPFISLDRGDSDVRFDTIYLVDREWNLITLKFIIPFFEFLYHTVIGKGICQDCVNRFNYEIKGICTEVYAKELSN